MGSCFSKHRAAAPLALEAAPLPVKVSNSDLDVLTRAAKGDGSAQGGVFDTICARCVVSSGNIVINHTQLRSVIHNVRSGPPVAIAKDLRIVIYGFPLLRVPDNDLLPVLHETQVLVDCDTGRVTLPSLSGCPISGTFATAPTWSLECGGDIPRALTELSDMQWMCGRIRSMLLGGRKSVPIREAALLEVSSDCGIKTVLDAASVFGSSTEAREIVSREMKNVMQCGDVPALQIVLTCLDNGYEFSDLPSVLERMETGDLSIHESALLAQCYSFCSDRDASTRLHRALSYLCHVELDREKLSVRASVVGAVLRARAMGLGTLGICHSLMMTWERELAWDDEDRWSVSVVIALCHGILPRRCVAGY